MRRFIFQVQDNIAERVCVQLSESLLKLGYSNVSGVWYEKSYLTPPETYPIHLLVRGQKRVSFQESVTPGKIAVLWNWINLTQHMPKEEARLHYKGLLMMGFKPVSEPSELPF